MVDSTKNDKQLLQKAEAEFAEGNLNDWVDID